MWRKIQLTSKPEHLNVLARASELAGFEPDDADVTATDDDRFRPSPARKPLPSDVLISYVHLVFNDNDISPTELTEKVDKLTRSLSGGRATVKAGECIVFIPDFSENDWLDDVWPAAERLHAAERRAYSPDATAADLDEVQALRVIVGPLVDMGNEDASDKLNWLGTMVAMTTGAQVPTPPTGNSDAGSSPKMLRGLVNALKEMKRAVALPR